MPGRILLIDDDAILCSELIDILREEGYSASSISNSKEAIAAVMADNYDLYLLDYKMEGMTGIDLLKILREKNLKSPVLFISGKPNLDKLVKREDVAQYVSGFMEKPFEIDELLKRIRELLSKE